MKKKAQSIIIAAREQCSSILCDGKLYWSGPITEIEFHHKAGEMASISITANQLPVTPDEDERLKDSFIRWLDELMKGFLTKTENTPSASEEADPLQE